MPEHSATTLTKATGAAAADSRPVVRATRPHVRVVRRLRMVCTMAIVVNLVVWLSVNLIQGTLASEFSSVHQWGPPVSAIVTSLLLLAVTWDPRLPPATIVRAGLVYEVVISYAIVASGYYSAWIGVPAEWMTVDRVGLTWVVPWVLFFTVLVQAPPREALVALIASGTAPAVLFGIEVAADRAPMLPAGDFFILFVLPYGVVITITYAAARIVHQLGVDAQRARELGSYRLEAKLGEGGMGEVWRASHHTLARPAAIKLIRPSALGSQPDEARLAAVRFEREAQAIASLQSRHTVELYDFGTAEDGTLYYVMELLDGVDLEALVRRYGPLPPERVVHILHQACASLGEAHRRGVIHRDIKPANIYLCREAFELDVVKILDFGLVKRFARAAERDGVIRTGTEVIAGTPAYMAPEIAMGHDDIDGRADLYGLGCVAYWLLTGQLLFDSDSPVAAIAAHIERHPAPPSARSETPVPAALDDVVMACLEKNPASRPASADVLAQQLAAIASVDKWTQDAAARWWEAHGVAADSSS